MFSLGLPITVLLEAEKINNGLLLVLDRIAKDLVPLAVHSAIGSSQQNTTIMITVTRYLHVIRLAKAIERLPDGASWKAIYKRVRLDLAYARSPTAPFAAPDGW